MKKLILGLTVASLCALAPLSATAQTLGPVPQIEYENVMFCIGKFEGGNDTIKNLRTFMNDKSVADYHINNNKEAENLLNELLADTKNQLFGFNVPQGESARKLGREPFDKLMKNSPPKDQWDYYQKNNALGKACISKVTNLVNKMEKLKLNRGQL